MTHSTPSVIVYTQPSCVYCTALKHFLARKGIAYLERDVAQDDHAFEELSELGYMSTPITTINGDIVVGFDRKKLEGLLGRASEEIVK